MTKLREPVSIENTLRLIAKQLPGEMAAMAEAVDRAPSSVNSWADPAARERLPLWAAIKLDAACDRAGLGQPLFELYELELALAREDAFACSIAFAKQTCALIREASEAAEAMVCYMPSSASEAEKVNAIRQLEDVVRVATRGIAMLRNPQPPPDTS